jgi:hypothetical protein
MSEHAVVAAVSAAEFRLGGRNVKCSAEAADDFLLAKNSVGMVRKVRMVMMQWQSQSLQSGGNFLWEVTSLEIVFSRQSKTTFAEAARTSITISFFGTATAKL